MNSICEKKLVVWYAGLVMLATSIPYFVGFQTEIRSRGQSEWVFSGFVIGVEDGHSYIAKMRSGYEGSWLFRTSYTLMPQNGLIAYLPYILLGKLAGPPALHEQLILLFHWFRIASGFLTILATYDFVAAFIKDNLIRWVCVVLATIGGGLGWILILVGGGKYGLPLEWYSPEAFGFLNLLGLPHLSLGRGLFLWTILAYLQLWRNTESQYKAFPWKFSLAWFFSGIAQPLYPGLLGLIMGAHWFVVLIQSRSGTAENNQSFHLSHVFRKLLFAGFAPSILFFYTTYKFLTDPYLKIWSRQNYLPSAPLISYVYSYGWLIPLVVAGAIKLWRMDRLRGLFLCVWMMMVPILVIMPFSIQRRLSEGAWVGIVTLAGVYLQKERFDYQNTPRKIIVLCLITLSLPSTIFLLYGSVMRAVIPAEPIFLPAQQVRMFEVLDQYAKKSGNKAVLAAYSTSNALPAFASVQVMVGHGPESAHGQAFLEQVKDFYSNNADETFRKNFLRENHINYVIWGDAEREYGWWKPDTAPYLTLIYSDENTNIYEVHFE
jgi:hypothetical protein